jgi:hypothetical protein
MVVPGTLKIALSALLFGVGLFDSGWHEAILDHYSIVRAIRPAQIGLAPVEANTGDSTAARGHRQDQDHPL